MTKESPSSELVSRAQVPGLVSVVITCYNQGRFLADAIDSVLRQTFEEFEIIIIDDGSTDNTAEISRQHPGTRYFGQPNQGLSAARNRGIQEAHGEFLVFLDADDRLLPPALEVGVQALLENPDCAFAFGDYRDIAIDGAIIFEPTRKPISDNYYSALLEGNCIEMHATVIYRRAVFADIGEFNTSLKACEDYDFYLRVARRRPICHFAVQVAEYRQHESNMSGDALLILRHVLLVLRSQKRYIKHNQSYKRACQEGLRSFAGAFAMQLAHQCLAQLRRPNNRVQGLKGLFSLCKQYPLGTVRIFVRFCVLKVPGVSYIRSSVSGIRK
jgi:glycosyltransferase involved in cell wall biosynthesis